MNEIVSIHIGGCGVNLFKNCWSLYCLDHGLSPSGFLDKETFESWEDDFTFTSFFNETQKGTYRARALPIDFKTDAIGRIKSSSWRKLLKDDQYLKLDHETHGMFGNGYFLDADKVDIVLDHVRKEVEKCDSCQGFQIYSAFNGGGSSGLAGRLIEELDPLYRKLQKHEYIVYPRAKAIKSLTDVYNMVLRSHQTLSFSNCSIMISNELLYEMCKNNLRTTPTTYKAMNEICARAIAATNTSLRYNTGANVNLEDIEQTIVPLQRMIFPAISFAPVTNHRNLMSEEPPLHETAKSTLRRQSQLLLSNPFDGHCIAACLLFRGIIEGSDISLSLNKVRKKKMITFAKGCLNVFKSSICYDEIPEVDGSVMDNYSYQVCSMFNTSSIKSMWYDLQKTFEKNYRPRIGVAKFSECNITEHDFDSAGNDLSNLIVDYCDLEKGTLNMKSMHKQASWLNEAEPIGELFMVAGKKNHVMK